MSSNSEKMSKVIDLLTESLTELKAISNNSGEYTREQVERIVKHAYAAGQQNLASSVAGSHFDAEVDTYCGDLSISGNVEVCMPSEHWLKDMGSSPSAFDVNQMIEDGLESNV